MSDIITGGAGPTNIPPGVFSVATVFGNFASYSPTQLGANAITLPASGRTVNTNIIDLRGAKQFILYSGCGQINNVETNLYDETGVSIISLTGTFINFALQNSAPTSWGAIFVGSESSQVVQGGSAINTLRLPLRAISFDWFNTTAVAATCTARLFVAY